MHLVHLWNEGSVPELVALLALTLFSRSSEYSSKGAFRVRDIRLAEKLRHWLYMMSQLHGQWNRYGIFATCCRVLIGRPCCSFYFGHFGHFDLTYTSPER